MFFIKYLLLLQFKISYFIARVQTSVENNYSFNTKLNMSVALAFYIMIFYVFCYNLLENLFNVRYTLFGNYGIFIYFLICTVIYYKLNLTYIRAIELTKKQITISRMILLVLLLALLIKIYTSIKN
jgi:hypothetical protein